MAGVPRGEQHHKARLTERQVREIRASAKSPQILAQRYGVGKTTIRLIRTGQTWRHVGDVSRARRAPAPCGPAGLECAVPVRTQATPAHIRLARCRSCLRARRQYHDHLR